MRSLLKRIDDFIHSLYLVLVGDLRISKYNEMEDRLDYILINMQCDDRWLCILPEVKPVVERHLKIVSSTWRTNQIEDISTFREKLKRTIEAERLFSNNKG